MRKTLSILTLCLTLFSLHAIGQTASVSTTPSHCSQSDGSATVSVTGGTTPYTYLWSTIQTTSVISGLTSGSYSVTVTDATSNTVVTSGSVLDLPAPNLQIAGFGNPTCFGGSNGFVSVEVLSGTTPYSYQWFDGSGNLTSSTAQATWLSAGAHEVFVTDGNGCQSNLTSVLNEPAELLLSFSSASDASCYGSSDGASTVVLTGGQPPYFYQWGMNSGFQTSPNATNLAAGLHTVTVTDATGQCTATGIYQINEPMPIAMTTTITDENCGLNNGAISNQVTGGTAPYSYLWNSGGTSYPSQPSLFGVPANMYNFEVVDGNGCVYDTTFSLSSVADFLIHSTITPPNCSSAPGAIATNITGTTSPYSFTWFHDNDTLVGATSSSVTGLTAGMYTVHVTDSAGCAGMSVYELIDPFVSVNASGIGAFCGNPGVGFVFATGGDGDYSFLWSDGWTTDFHNGLLAGDYAVTVTDGLGCAASDSITIDFTENLSVSITSQEVSCVDAADGEIHLEVTGGGPPYNFSWNAAGFGADLVGLVPGTYLVTITDADACTMVTSPTIIVAQGIEAVNVVTADATCGQCDGEANLNVVGGIGPFSYSWPNGSTTDGVAGLCASQGVVTVTDALNCAQQGAYSIYAPGSLSITFGQVPVTCAGNSDGQATGTGAGGSTPYQYTWSSGQNVNVASGLPAGSVTMTLTDADGCELIDGLTIIQPSALSLTAMPIVMCGESVGHVNLVAQGGVGSYQYSMDGNNYQPSGGFTNLTLGNHIGYVMDGNGCQRVTDATLTAIDFNVDVTLTQNSACSTWGIRSFDFNGTPPYTLSFSDGETVTTSLPHYNYAADISLEEVTIADAAGCSVTEQISIADACAVGRYHVNIFQDEDDDCAFTESIDFPLNGRRVEVTPGNQVYTTWNNGVDLVLAPGSYTVTFVDDDSLRTPCSGFESFDLIVDSGARDTLDFPLTPERECTSVQVNVLGWAVRPCFNNVMGTQYENIGTEVSLDTEIVIEIPGDMYANTFGTGFVSQVGSVLTFNVGTVYPGQSGYVTFNSYMPCDFTMLGQTRCFQATHQGTSCLEGSDDWDKSSISVSGECVDDSMACFTIFNTGDITEGDMLGTSQYRVYENDTFVYQGTFQLLGQESTEICWEAKSKTIRFEADQRPGHPGNSEPRAFVEACGQPDFDFGYVLTTTQDDDFIQTDIHCLEVTGAYDPNDKRAIPEGVTENHNIDSLQQLEYTIRFQNTGSDTAFNVYVYDTISDFLDMSTILPLASSHPMNLEYVGGRVLKFNFYNVLLPDSNVDEPGSHGFFKFKINQLPGNEVGSVINNTAGIVFDFNEAIITNTVTHTVGLPEEFRHPSQTMVVINPSVDLELNVYPNPTTSKLNFEMNGVAEAELTVYDLFGRAVKRSTLTQGITQIEVSELATGIYVYEITRNGEKLLAGKVIKQ